MKTLTKISLLAVASAALAFSSANAQTLTLQTVQDYDGSIYQFNEGQSLTQTFSLVTAVETMTYRFVSNSSQATFATTLQAYFVQWDPSTNRAIGAALWSPVGSQVIPSSSSGWSTYYDRNGDDYIGYDYTLAPMATGLNPNATYAMILQSVDSTNPNNLSTSTRIGLELISDTYQGNPRDSFTYGAAYQLGGVANFNTFNTTSSSLISNGTDFGFQQIVITPVPEPQTAAAILAVLFVAGLVGRRVYLKRQEAAAAMAPASVA